MPPKGITVEEACSQIMYTCSGDKEQYKETVQAVMGALQIYLNQMTKTALQLSTSGKITPDDVIESIKSDSRKHFFLSKMSDRKTKTSSSASAHSLV